MKKLLVILVLALVGNVAFAETTDRHPKASKHKWFQLCKALQKTTQNARVKSYI